MNAQAGMRLTLFSIVLTALSLNAFAESAPIAQEYGDPRIEEYHRIITARFEESVNRYLKIEVPKTQVAGETLVINISFVLPADRIKEFDALRKKLELIGLELLVTPSISTQPQTPEKPLRSYPIELRTKPAWKWSATVNEPGKFLLLVQMELTTVLKGKTLGTFQIGSKELELLIDPGKVIQEPETGSGTDVTTTSEESFFRTKWNQYQAGELSLIDIIVPAIIGIWIVWVFGYTIYKHFQKKEPDSSEEQGETKQKQSHDDDTLEPDKVEPVRDSVFSAAEIGVSDSAIDKPEDDIIGTSRLAKGLSLFLCHKKTQPPLTIAITGTWGSGKSSVMGMLRNYMKKARYLPVWFNVWHHQDEEHFFGALLENIRKDAIPPIWTLDGWLFRLRLIGLRLRKRKAISTFLVLGLVILIFPEQIFPIIKEKDWLAETRLFVVASLLLSIADKFSAFGFSGKDLVQGVNSAFKSVNLDTDVGLRYKVRQSLCEIDKALGERSMVLFIDDLDRCPANHVLKVLEVVNFLSSPPLKFYIVFGISLDKVIPIISPSFSAQVEEEFPGEINEPDEKRRLRLRNERRHLAKQYLRKMINIEVSIPVTSEHELRELINKKTQCKTPKETPEDQANEKARIWDEVVFPSIVAAFMATILLLWPLGGLGYLSTFMAAGDGTPETKQNDTSAVAPVENKQIALTMDKTKPSGGQQGSDVAKPASTADDTKDVVRGWQIEPGQLITFFVVAALLLVGIRKEIQHANRHAVIKDTNTFMEALDIWAPVITAFDPTPRHYIRIINQLRLLSMRMRIEEDPEKEDPRKSENIENANDKLDPKDVRMIHATLLTALRELGVDVEQLLPLVKALESEQYFKKGKDAKLAERLESGLHFARLRGQHGKEAAKQLAQALIKHSEKFCNLWPEQEDINYFRTFMAGVRL